MIDKIALRNFRNYASLNTKLGERTYVLTGANGQGKTNFLEAIFFVSMLRSFRTSQLREVKGIGASQFYVGADTRNPDSNKKTRLEIEYGSSRKLRMNGNVVQKASEFIRQIQAVAFSPDDIQIVTGNSGQRRRFVDMAISMADPEYMARLAEYLKALKSRNAILRSGKSDSALLKAFEPILAESGAEIVTSRCGYLRRMTEQVKSLLDGFEGSKREFEIVYRKQAGTDDKESYLARFASDREKDRFRGYTTFGPQMDEFDLNLNGRLLRSFGSTGQCRLISLCLKMAEVNLLAAQEYRSGAIIALVDDVTGELDQVTKEAFLKVVNQANQAFFTFTERPTEDYFADANHFRIEGGQCFNA